MPAIRLFVKNPLTADQDFLLEPGQVHYLQHVMRRKPGDMVALFNGRDGEWSARIEDLAKKQARLRPVVQIRSQEPAADLWLLFAPVKRARLDFIVEKATELGVGVLAPVFTRFTNAERVKESRMEAISVEAAEQSGRLTVPEVRPPQKLENLLNEWDPARTLIFCDEGGEVPPIAHVLADLMHQPAAVLIGPEGGFHRDERMRLKASAFVRAVSLGPRILRADTAAIAALALFQALAGDWR
ncbi:MAG: 16S rRNA (uracil(1498)-N(3))-methyltransferase [Alphaproteobacteria bacterium]|nr:MAG: 16S rRNA (uracil(1498)-N(3))-methyltransferase [Alphaproteobacteria bacterium]